MKTLKQEGYVHLFYDNSTKQHNLYNVNTKEIEVFVANKYFSGWAIKYLNTNLEFCSSWTNSRTANFIKGLQRIASYGEQHPSFHTTRNLLIRMELY